VHSSIKGNVRNRMLALLACAFGFIAAGCHHQNTVSGYGVAWITLTDEPGDFTSYIVSIDSVVLTGKTYGEITAIATPETMDITKLANYSEFWSSAPIPVDTYTNAVVTLDYTDAQIYVNVNGVPTLATVVDATGAAVTTVALSINLDPENLLTFQPTYASTNALRLAFDFDLAASSTVDLSTTPPTVVVNPYMTVATSASDSKLIRVRGPLVNSSINLQTYSTYVRPFFDEVNALGTVTIFNSADTIYTLDGITYLGTPGINALSQSSAGATMTAAFCTYTPTATLGAGITAGKFFSQYVIAGSTLEDFYTDGIEGDVIARSGNVLTLRGATLFANSDQVVQFQPLDSLVLLGTGTLVTADGVATLGPLDYNSVSVGQHITARGLYSATSAGVVTIDSTGTSDTNTGSVRLQSTELWGTLTSSASGSLLMNVQSIEDWPVSIYNFAGNGATAPTPASFSVNTGALALPTGTAAGDLLWVDGFVSPFGTAPPDFIAEAINAAPTVPATLVVTWTGTGTTAPFSTFTDSGLTIDLTNPAFGSGVIRIGAQSIDITTLAATPEIVPQVAPAPPAGLPPIFLPLFGIGSSLAGVQSFNSYSEFVTTLTASFAVPTPTTKLTARGLYNPSTNIFTASAIDVVN
jgi:hypothetical protein